MDDDDDDATTVEVTDVPIAVDQEVATAEPEATPEPEEEATPVPEEATDEPVATVAPTTVQEPLDIDANTVTEAEFVTVLQDALTDPYYATSAPADTTSEEADVATEAPEEVPEEEFATAAATAAVTYSPTMAPTFTAPTMAPTVRATTMEPTAPTTQGPDRSNVYFDLLNVTDAAVLQDTTSPQALSYLWMVEDDQLMPVPAGRKAVQRYIMVLMDHVLHEPVRPMIANPTLDECEWTGVFCNETTGDVIKIDWSRQGLTGQLDAPEIKYLESLYRLDLSENELVGTLDNLYEVTTLREIYLNNNQFSGTLSEQVGLLEQLEFLFLGHNQLEGQIPISLRSPRGEAKPLREFSQSCHARDLSCLLFISYSQPFVFLFFVGWLVLAHNNFTGYLPPDWRMRNLFYLDLGYNNLQGPLPTDWDRNMVRLRYVHDE